MSFPDSYQNRPPRSYNPNVALLRPKRAFSGLAALAIVAIGSSLGEAWWGAV